jgi:hypothetical protein
MKLLTRENMEQIIRSIENSVSESKKDLTMNSVEYSLVKRFFNKFNKERTSEVITKLLFDFCLQHSIPVYELVEGTYRIEKDDVKLDIYTPSRKMFDNNLRAWVKFNNLTETIKQKLKINSIGNTEKAN